MHLFRCPLIHQDAQTDRAIAPRFAATGYLPTETAVRRPEKRKPP